MSGDCDKDKQREQSDFVRVVRQRDIIQAGYGVLWYASAVLWETCDDDANRGKDDEETHASIQAGKLASGAGKRNRRLSFSSTTTST